MKIFFLGDIVVKSGRLTVIKNLQNIIEKNKIDFVIVNGENAANQGVGITEEISNDLFSSGVDVITTGNHVWDQKETINHIEKEKLEKYSIDLLSLTEEREVIDKISSTAEHALALTLGSLRNIHSSFKSVLQGEWNYEDHIGRQVNRLIVGVIGYGLLGKMFSHYIFLQLQGRRSHCCSHLRMRHRIDVNEYHS